MLLGVFEFSPSFCKPLLGCQSHCSPCSPFSHHLYLDITCPSVLCSLPLWLSKECCWLGAGKHEQKLVGTCLEAIVVDSSFLFKDQFSFFCSCSRLRNIQSILTQSSKSQPDGILCILGWCSFFFPSLFLLY